MGNRTTAPCPRKSSAWLCHQLGSSEHYSIPRALQANGSLALFQTDAWVPPLTGRWLPGLCPLEFLAGRYHPDLASTHANAFTTGRLASGFVSKLM